MSRAEDGVMLADGTLIVADQRYGLIRIEPSGKVSPFGNFEALGYEHNPPEVDSGPNGVHLTPNKQYAVTADGFNGKIIRHQFRVILVRSYMLINMEQILQEKIQQDLFGLLSQLKTKMKRDYLEH